MERIFVAVRARPLSSEEVKTSPWRISGNSISLSNHSTKFEFDRIFGDECKTVQVYEARTKEIVSDVVCGFNGTVFAYGQTNSGKTHTMRGSISEPGVIPLSVHDLFYIIQEDLDREFLLRMSYMEIYNEEINDLLAPEHRKLQIHESLERGIFVAGLREEIVVSPEQVLDFMEFGESHRHIGETNMNVYSSRSHTIFRMIIESREKTEDGAVSSSCDAVRVSVLNLVDLAGSERAAKTGAEGVRLKEGSHINKSLMTLGTVIKKLSEGAESQGGHVPYRDSKLTRILQPSLGGNANTAIICNITLAQIHADETKSSLQFASRALCVTNCAHVNEILTDAALLKRQRKEIEELRAKLMGSHSEHLGDEILNLRNTLLQSELERERIALELQQEKEYQAQWERTLKEQEKRIANLSSMVLSSTIDDKGHYSKKNKRRDTWCPGIVSRKPLGEVAPTSQWKDTVIEPSGHDRDMSSLLPFDELVHETGIGIGGIPEDSHFPDNYGDNVTWDECILPDAHALLHVTNRRKFPSKKTRSLVENVELVELKAESEDFPIEAETERTRDGEIEHLVETLPEAEVHTDRTNTISPKCLLRECALRGGESESAPGFVIKQLQHQIKKLEMEKDSIQKNLGSAVELPIEQYLSAREKYEGEVIVDSLMVLSMEVQGINLEVQHSRDVVDTILSIVDDLFQSFSLVSNIFLDFKSFNCQSIVQLNSIFSNHERIQSCMRKEVVELERDKSVLDNQSIDQDKKIQELKLLLENSENALTELSQQNDLEKAELLSQIQSFQKEISCLSTSSLSREKEVLRKELEKAKMKLKDTEFKFRNTIQEKVKLESEKAYAEREIKQLHSQKTLLERNICKRDSITDKRRESFAGLRCESIASDLRKAKGHIVPVEQALQLKAMELERANFDFEILSGDYQKLEVHAFELETKITRLEEELLASQSEKQELFVRNEMLASELEATSNNLSTTNSELKMLQGEVASMAQRLIESESSCQRMECSINLLLREKEEMALQITDALLELEEEKAIWSVKEKASIESIAQKAELSNVEIGRLSEDLSKVRRELDSSKEQCRVLRERLTFSAETAERERKRSMIKSSEIDNLRNDIEKSGIESVICQDVFKSKIEMLSLEHRITCEEVHKMQMELSVLSKERDNLLEHVKGMDQNLKSQLLVIAMERDKLLDEIKELNTGLVGVESLKETYNDMLSKANNDVEELSRRISSMEVKMHDDEIDNSIDKAKLRLRLRSAQAKLDMFRKKYNEAKYEMGVMNQKYEEASEKLKQQLAAYGVEVLHLKKRLAGTARE